MNSIIHTRALAFVRSLWASLNSCLERGLLLSAGAGLAFSGVAHAQALRPAEDYAPGELLIKFKATATETQVADAWQRAGLGLIKSFKFQRAGHPGIHHASTRLGVSQALRHLENHPAVEYAEPNYRLYPAAVPNDPLFSSLWSLNNTGGAGSLADADIDAPEAWSMTTGSTGVLIGVIDTGIDISHPDLAPNIWTNPGEIPGDGLDNDGNGYVDDVNGWDFWNGDQTVYDPQDGDSHGTHVAGIIGAVGNNGIGVVGVNWQAKLLPLKFSGPEFGYFSFAIEAVNYAAAKGVKVLNGSFGRYSSGPGDVGQGLKDAIAASGILFIGAAGNDANNNDTTPFYPASYDLANVIAVAATDRRDKLASFSSFGVISVDLGAPGAGILSTLPGNQYGTMAGTSMAAPHVAGVAGMINARFPDLSAAQVKHQILDSVDPVSALVGKTGTGGRLNAASALVLIADPNDPPIANAGPDQTVTDADNDGVEPVTLDGTASSDSDGAIVAYEWRQGADVLGHTATLLLAAPVGTWSFTLTVTDDAGATASDSVVVEVRPPSTDLEVFRDSFEDGLAPWAQDSQNDWFASTLRATDGASSAVVDGSASDAQLISPLIDLQGRTSATVSFAWLIGSSLDKGEYLACDVSTNGGGTWSEAARLRGNVDAENVWHSATLELPSAPAATVRLRFRGKMSAVDEVANVDAVVVVAH